MDALFGLSMTLIMQVLVVIFAISMLSVGYIFLRNRVMFKMGLRNLPRRGLQTGLIIVGLMLATLIITAAFTTGDTIDHSVTARSYDHWQQTDLVIEIRGDDSEDAIGPDLYVTDEAVAQLQRAFANDADIETFIPSLYTRAAATSSRTNLSEPSINLVGIDPQSQTAAGGLRLIGGGSFDLSTLGRTDALLSKWAAEDLDATTGDTLTLYVDGRETEVTVAGIVKDEQASGVLGDFDDSTRSGGIAMPLSTVQELTGHEGEVNYVGVSLRGGVNNALESYVDPAAERIEQHINSAGGQILLGLGTSHIDVTPTKQEDVEEAQEFGNLFTTFFLVIGMFSIAAGIMLIFMIFVMLATERKGEMGMARAVGAQRGNLVQSFVAEGMSYNLIAGAIGAGLGVLAAVGLIVGYLRYSLGSDFDFITAEITPRSLIISYCLGVVLTFITVVLAAMKVSAVNIVSAIRGTPEDETPEPRKSISWLSILIGLPLMIIPPLGAWLVFRKGLGVPWAWIGGVSGFVFGLFFIMLANSGGSEALFSLGFTLLPLSVAMIAAWFKAPARPMWTAIGIYLAAYWLSPWNVGEKLLGRELEGDIEMFVVSGIMVVVAFTLIIVWNARLLTLLFQTNGHKYRTAIGAGVLTLAAAAGGVAIGDKGDGLGQLLFLVAILLAIVTAFAFAAVQFPRLAPALKMGVAYPLSNRFRTGMTIAMFSLIIFSLTAFSAINANFLAVTTGEDGDGGYDVVATANEGETVSQIQQDLTETDASIVDDITGIATVSTYVGQQEVSAGDSDDFTTFPVLAASDEFLSESTTLDSFAEGYASEADVFNAVKSDNSLALLDVNAINDGFNDYEFYVDVTLKDDRFAPFTLTVRDAAAGPERTVTVIGIWSSHAPSKFVSGVYMNTAAYTEAFGQPTFSRAFIRLEDGVSTRDGAKAIESALATRGVQADSIRKLIDDTSAQDRAFTRMFQAFMALGLFVGIAALGVIAFRSVVERRQQIGMLRAIGYQQESIAATFVMESAFVALMGILSGVVGGVIVARNVFTTGIFAGEGADFVMPWGEVAVFTTLAFFVSLLMTWWPSRNASRVPVAEALRYE